MHLPLDVGRGSVPEILRKHSILKVSHYRPASKTSFNGISLADQ